MKLLDVEPIRDVKPIGDGERIIWKLVPKDDQWYFWNMDTNEIQTEVPESRWDKYSAESCSSDEEELMGTDEELYIQEQEELCKPENDIFFEPIIEEKPPEIE